MGFTDRVQQSLPRSISLYVLGDFLNRGCDAVKGTLLGEQGVVVADPVPLELGFGWHPTVYFRVENRFASVQDLPKRGLQRLGNIWQHLA